MQHLIKTSDFTKDEILNIYDDAKMFLDMESSEVLKGKLIVTLFFENSTRTRSAFEIAAKRLGAEVVSLDVGTSSRSKGETIFDTVMNINAMGPDAIIIRHSDCGLPGSLVDYVDCPVINAGDGKNAHPTQALLDLFTIMEHFDGETQGKRIAIVGDVKTSRVAGSNMKLLPRFGIDVCFVAPECFKAETDEFKQYDNISKVIDNIDIVMSLRTQLERHHEVYFQSLNEYAKDYCITKETFGNRDLLLLHPGPVNRNVDISDEMLLDPRCKVLRQVKNGVAVRMAVLKKLVLQ
ncbi:aspartate carbamoyltransferase catalytic subunit [Halarcobacter anaerophilus]|uniref:Aspartate carbamoyltransferase n=1 Tax=Halarcobacter anaerophilus TaxID=877500 RepID=A0A4Q0Y370_9BACT|nr:aspartate carbamoyltransferase catalytic subunit [Halarcobacter anaerophilus]QDF30053.1 aspartate carbamoyltransferase, catalytic subunit [Halarcobacter anaerophilus]RXJ63099.1 aspartate carbamoyltransferase [Halarcobacter anaerophilus]